MKKINLFLLCVMLCFVYVSCTNITNSGGDQKEEMAGFSLEGKIILSEVDEYGNTYFETLNTKGDILRFFQYTDNADTFTNRSISSYENSFVYEKNGKRIFAGVFNGNINDGNITCEITSAVNKNGKLANVENNTFEINIDSSKKLSTNVPEIEIKNEIEKKLLKEIEVEDDGGVGRILFYSDGTYVMEVENYSTGEFVTLGDVEKEVFITGTWGLGTWLGDLNSNRVEFRFQKFCLYGGQLEDWVKKQGTHNLRVDESMLNVFLHYNFFNFETRMYEQRDMNSNYGAKYFPNDNEETSAMISIYGDDSELLSSLCIIDGNGTKQNVNFDEKIIVNDDCDVYAYIDKNSNGEYDYSDPAVYSRIIVKPGNNSELVIIPLKTRINLSLNADAYSDYDSEKLKIGIQIANHSEKPIIQVVDFGTKEFDCYVNLNGRGYQALYLYLFVDEDKNGSYDESETLIYLDEILPTNEDVVQVELK